MILLLLKYGAPEALTAAIALVLLTVTVGIDVYSATNDGSTVGSSVVGISVDGVEVGNDDGDRDVGVDELLTVGELLGT